MLTQLLSKLENPERPLLGPNCKALSFWGLLSPKNVVKKYLYYLMNFLFVLFVVTEYIEICFLTSDVSLLLNNLKFTLLASMSAVKIMVFMYWQKHFMEIIDYITKTDSVQRKSSDTKIIDIINKYTKNCRIKTYLYWSLLFTTTAILVFSPFIKYIIFSIQRAETNNGTEKYIEVISAWVPFDKTTFVGYIGASAYQIFSSIYGAGWVTAFDSTAMVIMVFFRGELEMLRIDSSKIFGDDTQSLTDDVAFTKLKECHRRHVDMIK